MPLERRGIRLPGLIAREGMREYGNYLDYPKSIVNFRAGTTACGNYAWENQVFNNIMAEYLPRQATPPGAYFATYLLRASSAEKQ